MEDPQTGRDLGRAGAFSWHDKVPHEVRASFARAQTSGTYDNSSGGYAYWDEVEDLWWSFDTPEAIAQKILHVLETRRLGGVFAWGLGEDAPKYEHFKASSLAWKKVKDGMRLRATSSESVARDEL